jgi:uncharacterized protein (TIGR02246 family)
MIIDGGPTIALKRVARAVAVAPAPMSWEDPPHSTRKEGSAMWRIAVLVGCLSLGAAPALGQSKAAMQELEDAWAAAFNRSDIAAVVAMYAEDAYALPPGADMIKGRSAIEAFYRPQVGSGEVKFTTVDVLPLGPEAACELGRFTFKTKAQPPQEVVGKYALVWRKIGGDWKIAIDSWNIGK